LPAARAGWSCPSGNDDIRVLGEQFSNALADVGSARLNAVDRQLQVLVVDPTKVAQGSCESRNTPFIFRIIFNRLGKKNSDTANLSRLLRARNERPCGCCTEKRDEYAPLHAHPKS
jgi:hypothetical protein